jgi:hypothetical protein
MRQRREALAEKRKIDLAAAKQDPAFRLGRWLVPWVDETHARKKAFRCVGVRHECRKLKPNLLASFRLPVLSFLRFTALTDGIMPRSVPRILQA